MHHRSLRRAASLAMVAMLMSAVAVFADTVPADGDVAAGTQSFVDLGKAGPGQDVDWQVNFSLTCAGLSHATPGSTIHLNLSGGTVPDDGAATVTGTTIGPVPDDWTPAGEGCPSPPPTLAANGPSLVTLRMPTTPGNDYQFTLEWSRTGTTGLTGMSTITFQVDVVPNTPPQLSLPADLTVEATSAAGAAVTYAASATDAEDATAPTPTCSPASGSTFALGTTTVNCTVTDGGGLTDHGSFTVTVEDTTAPVLVGMSADVSLTTADPTGTTLTYTPPTATDAVDSSPTVDCLPASGSKIPLGTTTVTCTATDKTDNQASASFDATVTFVSGTTWSAVWGEPVATTGDTFATNTSRTIPVKVEIFANGVEQSSGNAVLSIVGCGGGTPMTMPLSWDGNRWSGHLDASSLAGPGCYRVTVSLDGNVAGSFRLDIRGDATPSSKPAKTKP
jgi:hypothetical protein